MHKRKRHRNLAVCDDYALADVIVMVAIVKEIGQVGNRMHIMESVDRQFFACIL